MANHVSAVKRAKQAEVKRAANRSKKSEVKSALKKIRKGLEEKNVKDVQALFAQTQSMVAKLGQSPVMKKKTASRLISRLAVQVKKLTA